MLKSLRFSVLCGAALMTVTTAGARIITIYRAGAPISATFATLNSALSAATNGDSLVLSADTFFEKNLIVNKNLIIKGSLKSGVATVINAEGASGSHVISVVSGVTVTMRDMTIMGGNATAGAATTGGGIYTATGTKLTLAGNMYVVKNQATLAGGGIYASGDLAITGHTHIDSNQTLGTGGGIYSNSSILSIDDHVSVNDNNASRGGGIYWNGKNLLSVCTIDDSVHISGNQATSFGGGIYTISNMLISGPVHIMKNVADTNGGGIMTVATPAVHLALQNGVAVDSNKAIHGNGGAISNIATPLDINGVQMVGNDAFSGQSIYSISTASSSADINISLVNSRFFNPPVAGFRVYEVHNDYDGGGAIVLTTDGCWWGKSDTSNMILTKPGNYTTINDYAVSLWSVNGGSSVSGLYTFPVTAMFALNTGSALPAGSFRMMKGNFTVDMGYFSPAMPAMSSNKIESSYVTFTAPPATSTVNILAVIDEDTFKANPVVTAIPVSIEEVAGIKAMKAYPNPASDVLHVEGVENGATITLYNVSGQVLGSWVATGKDTVIPVKELPEGNYLLQVLTPKGEKGIIRMTRAL